MFNRSSSIAFQLAINKACPDKLGTYATAKKVRSPLKGQACSKIV